MGRSCLCQGTGTWHTIRKGLQSDASLIHLLRAYARCRSQCRQYRRCNRCDKLNYKLDGFLLGHTLFLFFLRILRIIQILFPFCHLAPPSLVISSVVERSALPLGLSKKSPTLDHEISPCATLSRDDRGGCYA